MTQEPGEERVTQRYCGGCGEIFDETAAYCPFCGERWQPQALAGTRVLAAVLGELQALRQAEVVGPACFAGLRGRYEERLLTVRYPRAEEKPARRTVPPAANQGRTAASAAPTAPAPEATPVPAAGPSGSVLLEWTAARQADILLYLGAFLLSVAALIFVGYQGRELGGGWRCAILACYTAGFLGFGLLLPRWERVREAGVVFLALGAVLTPLNFVALHAQVAGHDAPVSWIWLGGAATTAALYLALALRGYGRLYLYPSLAAALVAWGALGAVADLPVEWFGAWFAAATVLTQISLVRLPARLRDRVSLGSELVAASAMTASQVMAAIGGYAHAQLPVTYALCTADLAAAMLAGRRSTRALALLPAFAALSLLTVFWASFGLGIGWYGCFVAAAAFGYLVNAGFERRSAERSGAWQAAAGAAAFAALAVTHTAAAVAFTSSRAALPLTYAELLIGAIVVYARWRHRTALAAIPALAAGFAITAGWALRSIGLEWSAPWIAAAALGYLVIAELDRRARSEWRDAAAAAGVVALLVATVASGQPGATRAVLPLTSLLLLAGAAWDATRGRASGRLLVPALAACTAVSGGWALGGVHTFAWIGCWLAAAALGYLALAESDAEQRSVWQACAAISAQLALFAAHVAAIAYPGAPWQLPLTYALVLLAAAWDAFRGREIGLIALPALIALLPATALWAARVPAVWWPYPGLAVAALLALVEPLRRNRPEAARVVRLYALAAALALPPLFAALTHAPAAHALAMYAAAAITLLVGALRTEGSTSVATLERRLLIAAGCTFLFIAAGYLNAVDAVVGDARAWIFVAIGLSAWGVIAGSLAKHDGWLGVFGTAGTVAMGLAAALTVDSPGTATFMLALGTAAPLVAFAVTRRWEICLVAATFGGFTLASAWNWRGFEPALLPLAFLAYAALLWAALTPLRRYEQDTRGTLVAVLTWLPWLVALGAAAVELSARSLQPIPTEGLVRTREWAVLTIAVCAAALALTAEGVRLGRRLVWVPGTVGLLGAALLAIAIGRPDNVQAYTVPTGIYLVALGLSFRRSLSLIGPHLYEHEALLIAGLLALALPAALQALQPGGDRYALEVIVQGLIFLTLGFTFSARWLVSGGVVALSAVAVRWLAAHGQEVPRWLPLGIVGMLLLVLGLLLLLERERWERLRRRVARWWIEAPQHAQL